MNLQLNDPIYKAFPEKGTAPINKQMPLLRAEGRVPLSAAGLMARYLEVLDLLRKAPKESKPIYASLVAAWEDNNFDTGDGVVRDYLGRVLVLRSARYLEDLTPKTPLVEGAVIPEGIEAWKDGGGNTPPIFSAAEVSIYCDKPTIPDGAKHNPFWQALAGWNQELLNEFVDARFARAKERFGYPDDSMMGVSVPPIPEKGTLGHAWCISGLMEYSGRADYGSGLGSPYGRLIGVAESRGKRNIPLSSPIGWHSTLENLVLENTRLPNRRFVF